MNLTPIGKTFCLPTPHKKVLPEKFASYGCLNILKEDIYVHEKAVFQPGNIQYDFIHVVMETKKVVRTI